LRGLAGPATTTISSRAAGQVSKNPDSTFLVLKWFIRTRIGGFSLIFAPNMFNEFILSISVDDINSSRLLFKCTFSNASQNLM
jgi:hypothetical protein